MSLGRSEEQAAVFKQAVVPGYNSDPFDTLVEPSDAFIKECDRQLSLTESELRNALESEGIELADLREELAAIKEKEKIKKLGRADQEKKGNYASIEALSEKIVTIKDKKLAAEKAMHEMEVNAALQKELESLSLFEAELNQKLEEEGVSLLEIQEELQVLEEKEKTKKLGKADQAKKSQYEAIKALSEKITAIKAKKAATEKSAPQADQLLQTEIDRLACLEAELAKKLGEEGLTLLEVQEELQGLREKEKGRKLGRLDQDKKACYEEIEILSCNAAEAHARVEKAKALTLEEAKEEPTSESWYIHSATREEADKTLVTTGKLYALLPASDYDIQKVVSSYLFSPVPGQSIKTVQVIYNPRLNRAFGLMLDTLNARHNKPAFKARWRDEQGESGVWRHTTHKLLETLAQPHQDTHNPHVKLVPMWHATNAKILSDLFETGFANLAMVDRGFFGKGIYSAGEARYSQTVYGKMYATPALLMNWVASYSAYPVIDGDMEKLQGGANLGNHDAHFIPVRPLNPKDPNESVFYPCRVGEKATYTEMVVFQSAQCLPRYVVELQSDLLKAPKAIEDAMLKQQAEHAQKSKSEQAVKEAEKESVARQAAEEKKDDEHKTEGRVKAYSPVWQPAFSKFWKPKVQTPPQVAQFLRLVAEGEQEKAELMLMANSGLALQPGTVIDLSKRTFEHITAFQYAVWARDWHMWTMLLKYLPEEEAALQLHSLEMNGTEHGTHFNLSLLIATLETYSLNCKAWYEAGDWEELKKQWCTEVGSAQRLLPAHVVNEYCHPNRSFLPIPDFTQGNLPRVRAISVDIDGSAKMGEWFSGDSNGHSLGEFGVVRGGIGQMAYGKLMCLVESKISAARRVMIGGPWWGLQITMDKTGTEQIDQQALQLLSRTREQQLQMLKESLYQNRPHLRAKVV